MKAGLPSSVIADVIKAYSYDVDFQRDIQEGDSFEVVYERLENADGELRPHRPDALRRADHRRHHAPDLLVRA